MLLNPTAFIAQRAQCEISRSLSYQVRHQVYCEELGFEPCNAQRQETDHFDEFADHFLITHNRTGLSAGTVRLILPTQNEHTLPIERFLRIEHPRHNIAEVSRIAVPQWLRDKNSARHDATLTVDERKQAGMLSLMLSLCALWSANEHKREHVYVLMERRLALLLSRFGVHFSPCGDPVRLNGERFPHYLSLNEVNSTLIEDARPLYELIKNKIQSPTYPSEALSA